MNASDFFARSRVRMGYVLAVVVLWLSRPEPLWILLGAVVGLVGLFVRAIAAGYLHKQEVLTIAGPYAYTRNPLYLGSSILALGAAIAMHSWWSAAILLSFFALVYSFVMRREETELRRQHPAAFDAYAAAVPLFFPRIAAKRQPDADAASFSWAQYRKNHEHQAAIGFLLFLLALVVIWRLHVA